MAKKTEEKQEHAIEKFNVAVATIVEGSKSNESAVPLPEGMEGMGREVKSLCPVVEFAEAGQYISGELVAIQDNVGPNKSKMYFLRIPHSGEVVSVWGSTILDSKIAKSGIELGTAIFIQRLEDVKTKRGMSPAKDWRVIVR